MFILLADFWSLLLVVPGRVFSPMSFTGAEAQTRCLCFSQLVRTWSVGVYNFRVCSIVPGMMIPVECINTMAMVWVTPENDENNGLLLPSSLAGIDDKPLDLPIGTHFWLKPSGTVPSKFTAPVTRDDLICLESFEGRTGLAASLAFCIARWILHQFDHFCCKMVFIHVWLVSGCSSGQNHTQPKSWAVRRGVDGSKSCYPGENNMSFQMDDRSRKNGTSSIDPSQHWFLETPSHKHSKNWPITTVWTPSPKFLSLDCWNFWYGSVSCRIGKTAIWTHHIVWHVHVSFALVSPSPPAAAVIWATVDRWMTQEARVAHEEFDMKRKNGHQVNRYMYRQAFGW